MDYLKDIIESISTFDLIYLIITIFFLLQCLKKGFVLSLLSASKWLLEYVITLIIFPRIKPYFKDVIDNEYVLDIVLGVSIFVVIIFIVLLINKGISRVVKYSGFGKLDTAFGFLFGFVKAYIISVCIFSLLNWFYPHQKWPVKAEGTYSFDIIYKGSKFLIEEFPNSKDYYDKTEEKIEKI